MLDMYFGKVSGLFEFFKITPLSLNKKFTLILYHIKKKKSTGILWGFQL